MVGLGHCILTFLICHNHLSELSTAHDFICSRAPKLQVPPELIARKYIAGAGGEMETTDGVVGLVLVFVFVFIGRVV